jgi:hypothetical protein
VPECIHLIDPASACGTCNPPPWSPPVRAPELWGPVFTASYNGECADCGGDICPGDDIRADGQGGYLCTVCGAEEELS